MYNSVRRRTGQERTLEVRRFNTYEKAAQHSGQPGADDLGDEV